MLPACRVVSAKTLKAVTPTEGHQNNADVMGEGAEGAPSEIAARGAVFTALHCQRINNFILCSLLKPLMPSSMQTVLFISPAAKNISRLLRRIHKKQMLKTWNICGQMSVDPIILHRYM